MASARAQLADTLPNTPIGVAFVDAAGHPGWPGDNPALTIHHPRIRGCLPRVDGLEPKIPPSPPDASSPATTRAKITKRPEFGRFTTTPFRTVLAQVEACGEAVG